MFIYESYLFMNIGFKDVFRLALGNLPLPRPAKPPREVAAASLINGGTLIGFFKNFD